MTKNKFSYLVTFTFIFVLFVLFVGGRYLWYGSITRNCVYTEEILTVPQQLIPLDIVVVKQAYFAVGHNQDFSCLDKLGSIDRQIVSADSINNITVGRRYFEEKGLKIESLNQGTRFKVVDVVAVTKHGITTVDSGPGPLYYLILKDINEALYQVATVSMGMSKEDLFLALEDHKDLSDSSAVSFLNWSSFDETQHSGGRKSFKYTGELTEIPKAHIERSKSFLETLYERLENGEQVSISINLELKDGLFKNIVLSDNREERIKQVAKIQENFLQNIPDKFVLEDVEKNVHHPYVSMQANKDLLDYLATEQTKLHIKSIAEIVPP